MKFLVDEFLKITEILSIYSEIIFGIQVVNISPLDFKRNIVLSVAINGVSQRLSGDVSPLALVPAESPLRYQSWLANHGVVSLKNFVWSLLVKEDIDV